MAPQRRQTSSSSAPAPALEHRFAGLRQGRGRPDGDDRFQSQCDYADDLESREDSGWLLSIGSTTTTCPASSHALGPAPTPPITPGQRGMAPQKRADVIVVGTRSRSPAALGPGA